MNPIIQVIKLLTYTLLLVKCIGQYDTTADLPSTMQTPSSPWNDGYMIPIAEIHNFHPESSVVTLSKPQIACLCWWNPDSNGDDGYEPVAVAFTYAIVDESNTDILHESPLSDLAYRPFSYDTFYHEPWMNVATSNDPQVNAHIAYMMNLDQKTQWKRVAIKITNKNDIGLSTEIDWNVASQGNTISFIVTAWRFSSNTNVGNTVTYSPTPIPTHSPTHIPTQSPTQNPTQIPTQKPTPITQNPSQTPSLSPTENPTQTPSQHPTTQSPTKNPSKYPTLTPTNNPTADPTSDPTADPTFAEHAVSDEHDTSTSTTLASDDRNVTGQSGFAAYYNNYILWVLVLIINVMICCLLIVYIVWKRRKLKTKRIESDVIKHNVLADSGSGSGAVSNMSGDIALTAMSIQNNVNMNVINPVVAAHVMGVTPFGIVTLDEHNIHSQEFGAQTGNDGDYDSDDSSKLYGSHEQDDDHSYRVTKGFQ